MDKVLKPTNPVVGAYLSSTQANVATLDLIVGPRYHSLLFEVIATAASGKTLGVSDVLGLINIKVNGKVQRAHTAAELSAINYMYGGRFGASIYNFRSGQLWYNGANYTGGTGLATVHLSGGGNNDLTVTPTVVNGVVTALAVVAGGTGYKAGDTFSITDSTGTGCVGVVSTVSSGAATALTFINPPLTLQGPVAGQQTKILVPVFFSEPWRKDVASKQFYAWCTSWQDGSQLTTFQVELTVPLATSNINTSASYTLNAYAETDTLKGGLDSQKQAVSNITRWERTAIVYGGTGDLPIVTFPKSDILLEQTFFCQPGDDISKMLVIVDGRQVRYVSKDVNDEILITNEWNPNGLNPDIFTLCFDYADVPTDGLVLSANGKPVQEFTVTPTIATAAATNKIITVISQKYGPIL